MFVKWPDDQQYAQPTLGGTRLYTMLTMMLCRAKRMASIKPGNAHGVTGVTDALVHRQDLA